MCIRDRYYMEYSTRIYQVYLKYIAPEDIVVYSSDEVFMDVTDYLNTYKLSAHNLSLIHIFNAASFLPVVRCLQNNGVYPPSSARLHGRSSIQ